MVRVVFIGEGNCEVIFLRSKSFKDLAHQYGIEVVNVVDADGNGNLNEENLTQLIQTQRDNYVLDKIVVLRDLDDAPCITSLKENPNYKQEDVALWVARKAIESWILADDDLMQKWLNQTFSSPEETIEMPFEFLRQALLAQKGRGLQKTFMMRKALKDGFSLEKAANHSNCPSAKYVWLKLCILAK